MKYDFESIIVKSGARSMEKQLTTCRRRDLKLESFGRMDVRSMASTAFV